MNLSKFCIFLVLSFLVTACASLDDKSSRRFSSNVVPPVSILVLPPLNLSNDLRATYSFLSTISEPLGEIGYYVLPVAVIDAYLKANGLPNPHEMHQVPIQKYNEILGADAVLYIEIDRYGQEFNLISSSTVVSAKAKLISTYTAENLWSGSISLSEASESGKKYYINNNKCCRFSSY